MREKVIEQKLVAEVKKRGGICPKWVSPGFDGMPDRIVLLPGRHFGGGQGSGRTSETAAGFTAPASDEIRLPGLCT